MEEKEHIKAWLNKETGFSLKNGKPLLNKHLYNLSSIEIICGIPAMAIQKWLYGHQELSLTHVHNLIDALSARGYLPVTNEHNFI